MWSGMVCLCHGAPIELNERTCPLVPQWASLLIKKHVHKSPTMARKLHRRDAPALGTGRGLRCILNLRRRQCSAAEGFIVHNVLVGVGFVLLILIPCLVAVFSSSKEGHSGNTGEHEIPKEPTRPRGHSPSRIREAAAAMTARKEAKAAAEEAAARGERPSRIRQVAAAAFTRPEANSAGERPSRIRNVAAAIKARPPKDVPMASGDPGAVKPSIRELRAKHAAPKPPRS